MWKIPRYKLFCTYNYQLNIAFLFECKFLYLFLTTRFVIYNGDVLFSFTRFCFQDTEV